jgi:hypothetical protein
LELCSVEELEHYSDAERKRISAQALALEQDSQPAPLKKAQKFEFVPGALCISNCLFRSESENSKLPSLRKREVKHASTPWLALRPNPSAVPFNERLSDG